MAEGENDDMNHERSTTRGTKITKGHQDQDFAGQHLADQQTMIGTTRITTADQRPHDWHDVDHHGPDQQVPALRCSVSGVCSEHNPFKVFLQLLVGQGWHVVLY